MENKQERDNYHNDTSNDDHDHHRTAMAEARDATCLERFFFLNFLYSLLMTVYYDDDQRKKVGLGEGREREESRSRALPVVCLFQIFYILLILIYSYVVHTISISTTTRPTSSTTHLSHLL